MVGARAMDVPCVSQHPRPMIIPDVEDACFASSASVEMRCFCVWRRVTLHIIQMHFLWNRWSSLRFSHLQANIPSRTIEARV